MWWDAREIRVSVYGNNVFCNKSNATTRQWQWINWKWLVLGPFFTMGVISRLQRNGFFKFLNSSPCQGPTWSVCSVRDQEVCYSTDASPWHFGQQEEWLISEEMSQGEARNDKVSRRLHLKIRRSEFRVLGFVEVVKISEAGRHLIFCQCQFPSVAWLV